MRKGVGVKFWGILLLVLLLAVAGGGLWWFFSKTHGVLALLPLPNEKMPYALFHAEKGLFPERVAGMILGDSTLSEEGRSPLEPLVPILGGASESALMVWADGSRLRAFAAYQSSGEELKALNAGQIPSGWGALFPDATLGDVGEGVRALNAPNLTSPLLIKVNREVVCLAASEDMGVFVAVASGREKGFRKKWEVEPSWGGHMLISDGGVLAGKEGDAEDAPPLIFEVGMKGAPKNTGRDGEPEILGEARWSASGMSERLGSAFLRELKPLDWSAQDVYIPNPALIVAGISIPTLPTNRDLWPIPLRILAEQGDRVGLKSKEVRDLLAGPLVAGVAGKTRLLWFSLPGMLLDMSGRGELGYRLIDAFWETVFMGAVPSPVDGFVRGGATDLPFSLVAAARPDKVLIGLMDPENEKDEEITRLVASRKPAIGWLFLDLPRLGDSLNEMTQVKSLLSEEDADASALPDGEGVDDRMQKSLSGFSRLFISWEKPESGSAIRFK